MSRKVLMVLSSHSTLGSTGKPTGWYAPEAAHPHKVLREAGYEVDFVSPLGGAAPVTGVDLEDPVQRDFLENVEAIHATLRPEDVRPEDYEAIHFVGGHGTMWDFAENRPLALITRNIFEAGGAVSAVCHGPAGLVNVVLSDGAYLVAGRRVSSFTDDEERAVELADVVPYLLESKLKERGAYHRKTDNFDPHVEVDGRLVTGQNPASAVPMAEALVDVLKEVHRLSAKV